MTNDNWDEIVVKKNNFDLNSLINKDFLEKLEKISEDKQIDCINLSFVVRDKEIKIDENSDQNEKNYDNELLIIKDSFANSMIPFLTENYKKIHVIDLRYYNNRVSEYIKENMNIKDVLILYNAGTIDTDTGIMMLE